MKLVVLIYGLPGSGKTATCNELLRRKKIPYVSVDYLWRDLFPIPSFSVQESEVVFSEVLRALARIPGAPLVLLEGVFASKSRIDRVSEVCSRMGYTLLCILVHCEPHTAMARAAHRETNPMPTDSWNFLAQKFNSASLADFTLNTEMLSPTDAAESLDLVIESFFST